MLIQLPQLPSWSLTIGSAIALSLGAMPAQAKLAPTPALPFTSPVTTQLTQSQLATQSVQTIAAAEVSDAQFKTLFAMANKLANAGDYPHAIKFYQQIITKLREYPYKPLLASSLWRLGSFYQEVKDYPQALKNLDESAQIATQLGDDLRSVEDHRELLKNINARNPPNLSGTESMGSI